MKKYLICYFHWTDGVSSGFGDIIVTEDDNEDVYTEEEIKVIKEHIKRINHFSGCSIQNIIPLN